MTDLEQLLGALHQASSKPAVFAEFRIWLHWQRHSAAFEAAHKLDGPFVPAPGDTVKESRKKIWIAPPDKARVETTGTEGDRTVVSVGKDWWSYSPGRALRNVGSGASTDTGEDMTALLAPARYVGHLSFEVLGETERIGRSAIRVRARPTSTPADGMARMQQSMLFHHWGGGADTYELEVDRDRGAILRLEARRLDQPFRIVEVEALDFDPDYPDGTFDELELPPGETYEDVGQQERQIQVPLEEAARGAPFSVFAPTRVSPDWKLETTLYVPRRTHVRNAWVTLRYKNGGPVGMVLHIRESAVPSDLIDPKHAPPWEDIERAGVRMRVRGPADQWPQTQVQLEREGTIVALDSWSLPREDVVLLALSLQRVEPGETA